MHPLLINIPDLPTIEPLPKTDEDPLNQAKRAAIAHKRSRALALNMIKPGVSIRSICETIEQATRNQLPDELQSGIGFPTGVSINECAAHYTFNPRDEDILLGPSDVLKIDFGTHSNGRIIDSAFTVCFDPTYEKLLLAAKEATNTAIRSIGVDVRLCDIGRKVGEVLRSYELEIDGQTVPIRPVRNLNGHNILPYQIHGGISIPIVDNGDQTRIEGDQFYACETFATTGSGIVRDAENCSHYMLSGVYKQVGNPNTVKVLRHIRSNLRTLPFCPRYIDQARVIKTSCYPYVRSLATLGVLDAYPPLNDTKGSRVAQFEHTVYVTERSKLVLSEGDDY